MGSTTKLELVDLASSVTVLPLEESAGSWFLALSPDGAQAAFERAADIAVGNESQRYLQPQSRAPRPATLQIELQGHSWRLHAQQNSRSDYPESADLNGWWGHVTDGTDGEGQAWRPLRLWRAP